MNQLNSLILEGDLNGFEMVNGVLDFELLVHRSSKDQEGREVEEVYSFDCIAFGDVAEKAYKKFKLQKTIRIIGRLHQRKWIHEGQDYSAVEVICECISFD